VVEVTTLPSVGLLTGITSVLLWLILFIRIMRGYRTGTERRVSWVLMSLTALLASCGALAAAIGSAQTIGTIDWNVPYYALIFVTNVGRGALIMAALLLLMHQNHQP
jgi:hypothetical protein